MGSPFLAHARRFAHAALRSSPRSEQHRPAPLSLHRHSTVTHRGRLAHLPINPQVTDSAPPLTHRGYQYHATSTYTVADHVVSESCLAAMSGRDCITLLLDQLEANNGTLWPPPPPKSPPAAAGAGGSGGGASTSSRVTLVGAGNYVYCVYCSAHEVCLGGAVRRRTGPTAMVGCACLSIGLVPVHLPGVGGLLRPPASLPSCGLCLSAARGRRSCVWRCECVAGVAHVRLPSLTANR